ncbi:hypothetical protein U1Q18_019406 [Sarracenia purpurea var. burkii]
MASPIIFSVFFLSTFLLIFLSSVHRSYSEILLLPLTHSLSTTQFNSTHHLLKSIATRSASRFQRNRRAQQVSLPLFPGSDFTISLSLGSNPPQNVSLYMDTGSDLVWFPCHPFQCILCEGKYYPDEISNPGPLNLPASAAPVSCKSRACSAAHDDRLSSPDLCTVARCPLERIATSDCAGFSCPPFNYAYGDGNLNASLYTDNLSIPMSASSMTLRNFTFGCAHSALAEPIGVAGFGRGVLSLPEQLADFSPQLGNQFSYCLVPRSYYNPVRRPSPLILGRYSVNENEKQLGEFQAEFTYTPMLDNPIYPNFYIVGLEAVSVGKRRVAAPESLKRVDSDGNGGMLVDSGTTLTILPTELYQSVVREFAHRVGRVHKRASQIENSTGLSPCYYLGDDSADDVAKVPAVVLHFVGNSSVALPRSNYFYQFLDGGDEGKGKRKVGCVMLLNGGDDADERGTVGTLGNYQQQGFEVVYDLENRRVGFARRKCASLWDSLNQR